jgi:hypothetical protein
LHLLIESNMCNMNKLNVDVPNNLLSWCTELFHILSWTELKFHGKWLFHKKIAGISLESYKAASRLLDAVLSRTTTFFCGLHRCPILNSTTCRQLKSICYIVLATATHDKFNMRQTLLFCRKQFALSHLDNCLTEALATIHIRLSSRRIAIDISS